MGSPTGCRSGTVPAMTDVVLLDGGVGEELIRRAGGSGALWATGIMADHPGLATAVHGDFLAAGATVATANTYALHRDRLAGTALEGRQAALIAQAVAEARAACAAAGRGRVAGSIGPLAASYRPDLHPPEAEAAPLYAGIARALAPGCDLILAETVASLTQARAVLAASAGLGRPVWLSVTVDDEDGSRLRSGEAVAGVLEIATGGGAAALLSNCSAPEAMPRALEILARAGLPFGAYANGFARSTNDFLASSDTPAPARPDLEPEGYAASAMGWVAQGATIVGGCCAIGPAHIAAIAAALRQAGHRIV